MCLFLRSLCKVFAQRGGNSLAGSARVEGGFGLGLNRLGICELQQIDFARTRGSGKSEDAQGSREAREFHVTHRLVRAGQMGCADSGKQMSLWASTPRRAQMPSVVMQDRLRPGHPPHPFKGRRPFGSIRKQPPPLSLADASACSVSQRLHYAAGQKTIEWRPSPGRAGPVSWTVMGARHHRSGSAPLPARAQRHLHLCGRQAEAGRRE